MKIKRKKYIEENYYLQKFIFNIIIELKNNIGE